jgi:polysaccharide biosynthesis protein PslH
VKLLMLAPFPPRTDGRHGGARATASTIVALGGRHELGLVHLAAPDGAGVDPEVRRSAAFVEELPLPDVGGLRRWTRRVIVDAALLLGTPTAASELLSAPAAQRLRAIAAGWRPDAVHVESLTAAVFLSALDGFLGPRVLVDHDASLRPVQSFDHLPAPLARSLRALEIRSWRRFERATARRVDAAVVFTERDLAAAQRVGFRRVRLLPLVVAPRERPLDPVGTRPRSVLFVGYYRHPPNADAARWLVDEIFPRIRAEDAEAELVLVGDELPADVLERAGEHVVATGAVEDVRDHLDRAAVVVAPLRIGGGTRVKVLEALGAGKAVVATPRAVEGLDVPAGEAIVLARSTEEFADAVSLLLRDSERRRRLATSAYAWARTALDPHATADRYDGVYAELGHGTAR